MTEVGYSFPVITVLEEEKCLLRWRDQLCGFQLPWSGGGGDLPALDNSVTAMSMKKSVRGCSEEFTGSETKGGLLMGVSNLTIRKKNWIVWHMT
jgi:hypothetical protein